MTRLLMIGAALLAAGCEREPRTATPPGHVTERHQVATHRVGPPRAASPAPLPSNPASEELLQEGRQLYNQFNCSGCHAAGGGAIGPPLMDAEWIYGSSPDNIFYTIVEGRPQGMPAFGGRIADGQVRTIATYVRSLSGLDTTEPQVAPSPATEAPGSTEDGEAESVRRGREVFMQGPCAVCHTIRGTLALATVGPDLTRLASRETIAGILPNTRGNLAGWILNPQNLKPGTQMPPTLLEPDDLHAMLAFLETLK
jgi:cytochrome c oxidase cbb3-type subunit 3